MPNHFHGIIIIVGADLRVCPENADLRVCPDINNNDNYRGEHIGQGEHIGSPLHKIVQWFKTMTTNDYIKNVRTYNWKPFNKKLWQRNYYEHIIRNEIELDKIREYILNNPMNWEIDENYRV
jgi:hypothetical protein